jgi:RNA polymerase sigma factor (TIGR02999 family)
MSRPLPDPAAITRWLESLDAGEAGSAAVEPLFTALYDELKAQARRALWRESQAHTLSATALTHEAWFRLAAQTRTRWESRGHFLGMAAVMMRRILVNQAAARQADKRDAALVPLTLSEAGELAHDLAGGPGAEVLRVHEALLAFEAVDPRAARVVELKFFGGLENEEIAEAMGLGLSTVKRDWQLARAWLLRELQG